MKATQLLHNLGQSIWLDNITRSLLDSGTLKHYIDELSVTGLTSNPNNFRSRNQEQQLLTTLRFARICLRTNRARRSSSKWRWRTLLGLLRCLGRFTNRTNGVDGWVSLKSHRCWHTRQPAPWLRPRIYTHKRATKRVHQDPRY